MPELALLQPSNEVRFGYARLEDLVKWDGNPKQHALEDIKDSIRRFGARDPIEFDPKLFKIVSGNGRCTALTQMKESGDSLPEGVIEEDGSWWAPVLVGKPFVDEAEAAAYLVATNRTNQLGGWTQKLLLPMLKKIEETRDGLKGSGFNPVDLTAMEKRSKSTLESMTGLVNQLPTEATQKEMDKIAAKSPQLKVVKEEEPEEEEDPTGSAAVDSSVPKNKQLQIFASEAEASQIEAQLDEICEKNDLMTRYEAIRLLISLYEQENNDLE